jgi:hypothetical protein
VAAGDTSIPPQAPDVTAQQSDSPLAAYADKASQAGSMQPQQKTGMDLAESLMNDISQKLTDVAKVLAMENPVLIEYVKKIAQVGAQFMQEIQAAKQKQQSQGSSQRAGLEPTRQGTEGQPTNAIAA